MHYERELDLSRSAPARSTFATVRFMRDNAYMTRVITQRELRNQSAAILREVEGGRTIIVSRNGTPVAELRPIQSRRFVPRAVLAAAAARAPQIDATRFRADVDAVIGQSIDD